LAKGALNDELRELLEQEIEEATETEEIEHVERVKTKWARLEAIVGHPKRIENIAQDFIDHYEERLKVFDGKAMFVCMSRRIAVDLYNAVVKLKPEWHSDDDTEGAIKVIMTGSSSDPADWQQHYRTKERRKAIGERLKNPHDPLKIVIVRDMWLTGFDAPCLHTLYVDKPMKGHNLMQAIARVNRVFKDKPGGLIVDFIGIAPDLKRALAVYTESGGKGVPTLEQEDAVSVMLEKYEIILQLMNGFDFRRYFTASTGEKMSTILEAEEFILGLEDGKSRFNKQVDLLSKAFALSVPHPKALAIKDDLGFFQAVKARLNKFEGDRGGRSAEDIETALKQIVSRAIISEQVIDVFDAAGLKKPDISILSDEFLAEIRGMKHKNLALELLRKILNDEIKGRMKKNLIQSRSFLEMLEKAIRKYQNQLLTTAQIIDELISLAKDIREADRRGENLKLSDDELAFYDALEVNDSAVKVLGDDTLRDIARELVMKVRENATIDWTIKESVRARLKVMVKRTLRKYGYPPDKAAKATETVLEQAKLLADFWTGEPD